MLVSDVRLEELVSQVASSYGRGSAESTKGSRPRDDYWASLLGQTLNELLEHMIELLRIVDEQGVAVAVKALETQLVAQL